MLAEKRVNCPSILPKINMIFIMGILMRLKELKSSVISLLPKSFLIIITVLLLMIGSARVTQLFDQGHNFYSKWNPIQEIPANHSSKDSTSSPDQISLYNRSEPAR